MRSRSCYLPFALTKARGTLAPSSTAFEGGARPPPRAFGVLAQTFADAAEDWAISFCQTISRGRAGSRKQTSILRARSDRRRSPSAGHPHNKRDQEDDQEYEEQYLCDTRSRRSDTAKPK